MKAEDEVGLAHERGLASLVRRGKRVRLETLMATERGRERLVEQLPHFRDWDSDCVMPILPNEQTVSGVSTILQSHGAPDAAYVISVEPDLDARAVPLGEALVRVVGFAPGTVVSCVPGRLAYYEGEGRGNRCILRRTRATRRGR